ncbi:N-acetylmuramoyl-L-alanine amidase [Tepidibacter mesophilus]|uniref:N-acetylmuramoyl-L-alanine amidase n=1 Tax=Tepidibacter mesophilus TaxID=655607 RepID=UPI000C07078D|nr:N-acetylmuramoyl-L-alanine amidase [Tepidibacter mesophilus]
MNIIDTNLEFRKLNYINKPNNIILHHAAHSNCSVYDVHRWHKDDRGWSGIGYHFFITKEGLIYRGRPEKAIGAHCLNHNSNTIGICTQGNYTKENMPVGQEKSLIELCIYLCTKYGIKTINGHRELNLTDCPGIYYPLKKIKKEALYKTQEIDNYTVKCGDTLWSISKQFNMSVNELKKLNYLNTDIIYPNQILRIL